MAEDRSDATGGHESQREILPWALRSSWGEDLNLLVDDLLRSTPAHQVLTHDEATVDSYFVPDWELSIRVFVSIELEQAQKSALQEITCSHIKHKIDEGIELTLRERLGNLVVDQSYWACNVVDKSRLRLVLGPDEPFVDVFARVAVTNGPDSALIKIRVQYQNLPALGESFALS